MNPQETEKDRKHYRYPGVTPFSTAQSNVFFGRKQDIDELYRLIRREQLVVLHGKSGLGKSSLLNAGIAPKCLEEQDLIPVFIRFGAWREDAPATPLEITRLALNGTAKSEKTFLDRLLPDDNSLWTLAKIQQILPQKGRPLLIFDQFEELFSYPENVIEDFLRELSELLNTGIPLRYRRLAENTEILSETEEDLLEKPLDPRTVIAIRSDRMHLLDRMKNHLTQVMRHTFELKALSLDDARDAIVEPARVEGDFVTPPFEFTPAALDKLLDYLADKQDQRVEGILLQMLCEHYERKVVEIEGVLRLGLSSLNDPGQVVKKYYDEKIQSLPQPLQRPARRLIEEGLVSEGDTTMRLSLHENYIAREFGVEKSLLEALVDNRLLRSEVFLRGGYTYELSHDRLVPAVLNARKSRIDAERLRRQERERKVAEERRILKEKAKMAEKERLLREQAEKARLEAERQRIFAQRKEKQARRRAFLAIGFAMLAISALAVAVFLWFDAETQRKEAERQHDEALQQEKIAKQALAQFTQEQIKRERLRFNDLERRANAIMIAGGCPTDLLSQLKEIADNHPDSTAFRTKISFLYTKNKNCK